MIVDRPYQTDAVRAIWQYFIAGRKGNPVVAMPTGTGKSIVIGRFVESVFQAYTNQHILILTHVKELIEQNYKKLIELIPTAPAGIYSAGLGRKDYGAPITFAGINSVAKKAALFKKTNLVLIDECHLVSPNSNTQYQKFIAELRKFNPHLKVIGFSATPFRLGLGLITDGGLFTDVCYNNTGPKAFEELIINGWLAPLIPKQTKNYIDSTNVTVRGGDFVTKDLEKAIEEQNVTQQAIQELLTEAYDRRKWLLFATSINHALEITEHLNYRGISAAAVHSKMSTGDRDTVVNAFRQGQIRAVVNRDILTTGFDVPDLDCIAMLRPTQSPGLWVQMLGRGTRPAEDKRNCLVLDFARNTERLGPIDDPVLPKRRGKGGGGSAPVRVCPACFTLCHTRKPCCEQCGYEFPIVANIDGHASHLALLSSQDLPQMEIYPVHSMIAEVHNKPERPPSMRVSYYAGHNGAKRFSVFVCLEHGGVAAKVGREWWRAHTRSKAVPDSTDAGITLFEECYVPTHIRVWINKRYPEVMAYDFENTGFGQYPERRQPPQHRAGAQSVVGTSRQMPSEDMSDVRAHAHEWQDFE